MGYGGHESNKTDFWQTSCHTWSRLGTKWIAAFSSFMLFSGTSFWFGLAALVWPSVPCWHWQTAASRSFRFLRPASSLQASTGSQIFYMKLYTASPLLAQGFLRLLCKILMRDNVGYLLLDMGLKIPEDTKSCFVRRGVLRGLPQSLINSFRGVSTVTEASYRETWPLLRH